LFMNFMKEMGAFIEPNKRHPVLGKHVAKLEEAKNILADLTMKFASVGMQDITFPVLNASAYLESFGDALASFVLLKQALLANEKLTKIFADNNASTLTDRKKLVAENPEAKFYHGKIQSAQFYASYILPRVKSNAEAIKSNDKSPLDVEF
ncbi:MAG: acyl-CoA dehydrogenase C-terminal domain-containing protein, partial [Deltaproteobacteria bacterium]|nr:acyl-CoA dehydrogenase C-terminal domain-containing protein [Deltaproteobacteria bacterium]